MATKAQTSWLGIWTCIIAASIAAIALAPQAAYAQSPYVAGGSGALETQSFEPFLGNMGGDNVYTQGKFKLKFEMWTDYQYNKYEIEIRKGSATGELMGTASGDVTCMYSYPRPSVTIDVDATNWAPGKYTIVINTHFYSFMEWRDSPRNPSTFDLTIKRNPNKVTIKTSSLKIKQGKSAMIKFSPKKGVTVKKVSGNKKISVTKAGKVKVSKKLKKGTYTIKVKAYKSKKLVTNKKIKIKVVKK